jgi:uncharacterized protein YbjT (DUF2867 family)
MSTSKRVLVTGATGYVGGSLVPRLLQNGHQLRVLARNPSKLKKRSWSQRVEVFRADVLDPESLPPAMSNVRTAYYLIHNMTSGADFVKMDLAAAHNFGRAAKRAGVEHIIYLGGLGDPDAELSDHLRSRQETGAALRDSGVCTTELRAAIIVGAGSVSFEMIRHLTEVLPVMICPRWVFSRVQPISIDEVLEYLLVVLERGPTSSDIIEIGGSDVITYGQMMKVYARVRGLRRLLVPVPVLTPNLSSYCVHLATPVAAAFAHPLIEGLRSEVVLRDHKAIKVYPQIVTKGYEDSVRKALEEPEDQWFHDRTQELSSRKRITSTIEVSNHRGMVIEQYQLMVKRPANIVYRIVSSLGGRNGWLVFNWLWRFRALFDRLIGGVGMRGRINDSEKLYVGQIIDFFRVEQVKFGKLVRLRVEMKIPGTAWLQFEIRDLEQECSEFLLTVFYHPKGLGGLMYWYLFYIPHRVIFAAMAKKIVSKAEEQSD